jgi:uncharacterized protein YwgA
MKHYENAAIVVELVEQLRGRGSWCGATHLQKTAYFLKHLTEVPVDFDFILYKHGPFSFDLQDEVSYLSAYDLLDLKSNGPRYGASLVEGGRAQLLRDEYGYKAEQYRRQIEFVADRLADKGVVELEKLGTALWVTLNTDATTTEERAREMVQRKPHISYAEALTAVRELDAMQQEWASVRN